MHDVLKVDVKEDIYRENNHIAAHINEDLTEAGIFMVNVMGAPGVGKTTSLKRILENLKENVPYIIEGDIESDLDTKHLRELGIRAFQINTFGACHLDAPQIHNAVQNILFEKDKKGILFVENIGNLVCPAEFVVGEHIKLLISPVTEGSDKPYKYPLAFEKADVILLNKVDLLPYLDFDEEFFMKGVRALNPDVPVFKVSGRTGEGYAEVAVWLEHQAAHMTCTGHHHHGDGQVEHHHHHGEEEEHHHHE